MERKKKLLVVGSSQEAERLRHLNIFPDFDIQGFRGAMAGKGYDEIVISTPECIKDAAYWARINEVYKPKLLPSGSRFLTYL